MAYIPKISNARLGADAVQSSNILDGEIVNADINASAAIDLSKLATDPLARANHTGTQAASTISDFDTQVQTSRLDQMAAPTASVAMNSQKMTGLAAGSAAGDAVEFAQFDAAITGLSHKDAVAYATVAALPANTQTASNLTADANGALTVDGVAVADNDRILVKDESGNADANGIYVVTDKGSAGTPWILDRADDADSAAEITDGATVWVQGGNTLADTRWTSTAAVATLNTDTVTFAQTGSATVVSALSDLSDADTTGAADGDIFRYESGTSEWVPTGTNMRLNDSGQLQLDANSQGVRLGGATGANIRSATSGVTTIESLGTGNSHTVRIDGLLDSDTNPSARRLSFSSVAASAGTTSVDENTDDIYFVTGLGSAAHTLELPATPAAGQRYVIKDASGGAATNNLTISTAGSETIDGASTFVIDQDYMGVQVVSDGTNYFVV